MGPADELLEDARHLAEKGIGESRASCMRRSISTAYYAVFHLFVEDFVNRWPFADQRARLARMFDHRKMRDAQLTPQDPKNPSPVEAALADIKRAFSQLQADRHRADYDLSWNIVATDVATTIRSAEETFTKWRSVCGDDTARNHLLSMFGANRG